MHLNWWQPLPSFHQEGLLSLLAETPWVRSVTLHVEEDLPALRRASGWREGAFGAAVKLCRIDDASRPEASAEHVHIFTGLGTHPGVWAAHARLAANAPCRRFAYAEAPELHDWRAPLRRIKYRLAARRLGRRLDGLLAVGRLGETFYRSVFGPAFPVHRFAYYDCRESGFPADVSASRPPGACHRLLAVGQLIRRKGLDRLLRALAPLHDRAWQLEVVGTGPEEARLRALAIALGIADKLVWQGGRPRAEIDAFYAAADHLILPSRWDGWGMSAPEALRHGCGIVVSETCGAADLAEAEERLPVDDSTWSARLAALLAAGPPTPEQRAANRERARRVSAEAGVRALQAILLAPERCALHPTRRGGSPIAPP